MPQRGETVCLVRCPSRPCDPIPDRHCLTSLPLHGQSFSWQALDGVRTIRQAHGSIATDLGPEQQPWLAELHRQVEESAELLLAQADAHDTAAAAKDPRNGREALLLASAASPCSPLSPPPACRRPAAGFTLGASNEMK